MFTESYSPQEATRQSAHNQCEEEWRLRDCMSRSTQPGILLLELNYYRSPQESMTIASTLLGWSDSYSIE